MSRLHQRAIFAAAAIVAVFLSSCATSPASHREEAPSSSRARNDPAKLDRPYVILVSIDGYRWDYTDRFQPKNLSEISSKGARAESLIPVFPSKTFPNHYSIATGLYPGHHGLVSNEFRDPETGAAYGIKDKAAVADARWYGGEPIWNTVQKQGLLAANCFWVGSEAAIGGMRSAYWLPYDDKMPMGDRVEKVLSWLALPPETRPHLVTVYFSAVDSAGHEFGPESPQTEQAVSRVDQALGHLREGIRRTGLPVNLVIVSDHGMQSLDPKETELFGKGATGIDLDEFEVVSSGSHAFLYHRGKPETRETAVRAAVKALSKKARHFKAYAADALPTDLFPARSPRFGDVVLVADPPFSISESAPKRPPPAANHGWDPLKIKSMHGILYAEGPGFVPGGHVGSILNIHVVPLVSTLLGTEPPKPIDGSLDAVRPLLSGDVPDDQ